MHVSDVANGFGAPANLLQLGMLALLFFGQIFAVWQSNRADRSKAVKLGEAQSKANTEVAAAIKEASAANERLAKALESITEWARTHDLADAPLSGKDGWADKHAHRDSEPADGNAGQPRQPDRQRRHRARHAVRS